MSAPNHIQLFNFAEVFEGAVNGILSAASIPSYVSGSPDVLPLEHITVAFEVGAADPDHFKNTNPEGDKWEYTVYRGCRLEVTVSMPRDSQGSPTADALSKLNYYASAIRALLRESERPLDTDNLEWYCVHRLRPAGESNLVMQATNSDVRVMRWDIDFEIMADAWPAS